jgi:hypothetical protein
MNNISSLSLEIHIILDVCQAMLNFEDNHNLGKVFFN